MVGIQQSHRAGLQGKMGGKCLKDFQLSTVVIIESQPLGVHLFCLNYCPLKFKDS